MATMTPTVVSRPQPASAIRNNASQVVPPASRKQATMPTPMTPAVRAADSRPNPKPDRITVAAPVRVVAATRRVGLPSVPV